MLGRLPGGADEPGFIPGLVNSIAIWFNSNVMTVASDFQTINDLENVRAVLRRRFGADVQSGAGGLSALQKQMGEHRERFVRLRSSTQAAELFANSLDAATIARLGGRAQAIAFFLRLTGTSNPRYLEFINAAEQFYAQRVANDIVTAQIATHRRDGNHTLDLQPPDRFISPQEEQNLIASNAFLLERIIGSDVQPLNGMFAAMAMRQLLTEFRANGLALGSGMTKEGEEQRMRAIEHIRQLAYLYTALQPLAASPTSVTIPGIPPPLGGAPMPITIPADRIDTELRYRVRNLAEHFLALWNAGGPTPDARAKHQKALRATPSFDQGLRDLYNTMRLLNVDTVVDPGTGRRLQQEIDAIISGPYLPGGPDLTPGASTEVFPVNLSPGASGTIDYLVPGTGPIALRLNPGPSGTIDFRLTPGASPISLSMVPGAGGSINVAPGASGVAFNVTPGAGGSVTIPAGPGRPAITLSPGAGGTVEQNVPGAAGTVRITPGPGGITVSAGASGPTMQLRPGATPGTFDLVPSGAVVFNTTPGSPPYFEVTPAAGAPPIRIAPGSGAGAVRLIPAPGDPAFQITPGPGGSVRIPAGAGRPEIVFNPGGGTVTEIPGSGGGVELTPGAGNAVTFTPGGGTAVTIRPGSTPGTFSLSAVPGATAPAILPGPTSTVILNPVAGAGAVRITPGSGTITQVPGSADLRITPGSDGRMALNLHPGAVDLSLNPAGDALVITPGAGVTTTISDAPGGGRILSLTPGSGAATAISVGPAGSIEQPAGGPIMVTPGPDGISILTPGGGQQRLVPGTGRTLILRPGN